MLHVWVERVIQTITSEDVWGSMNEWMYLVDHFPKGFSGSTRLDRICRMHEKGAFIASAKRSCMIPEHSAPAGCDFLGVDFKYTKRYVDNFKQCAYLSCLLSLLVGCFWSNYGGQRKYKTQLTWIRLESRNSLRSALSSLPTIHLTAGLLWVLAFHTLFHSSWKNQQLWNIWNTCILILTFL